jgi:hypothetical protein
MGRGKGTYVDGEDDGALESSAFQGYRWFALHNLLDLSGHLTFQCAWLDLEGRQSVKCVHETGWWLTFLVS